MSVVPDRVIGNAVGKFSSGGDTGEKSVDLKPATKHG